MKNDASFPQEITRTSQTYRRQNQSACPVCCTFLSRRARLPWHAQQMCAVTIVGTILKVARVSFLAWGVHRARIPLHFARARYRKIKMATRGYFCVSFNTFVWGYFWLVYLTLHTRKNPVLTIFFQEDNYFSAQCVSFKRNTRMRCALPSIVTGIRRSMTLKTRKTTKIVN